MSKTLAALGRNLRQKGECLTLESADGWWPPGSRSKVTAESAMKISAVSACVEIISNAIGMLPVYIMDGVTRRHMDSHPLGRVLWERPNEAMTPFAFFKLLECQRLLQGNAYAWIYRDGYGTPVELIPLPPGTCNPVIDPATGALWYWATEPKHKRIYRLSPADVLHLKGYSADGVTGVSVLHRARQTLETAAAASRYEQALYENCGRPTGVLKVAADLGLPYTDAEGNAVDPRDVVRKEWEKFCGADSPVFRTAILDHGIEYQAIAMNNADAQFVENKAVTIADIARFFGVPLHKLGEGKQSYSSNEQNNIEFCVSTIQPIVTQMEFEETYKLLTLSERERGLEVRHNMMALLRGDSASRAAWYKDMRECGVYSVNDIRALEDLCAVAGGDTRYASLNFIPLELFELLSRLRAERGQGDANAKE